MKVRCNCGTSADDFLEKLRKLGWAAPYDTASKRWMCPVCVASHQGIGMTTIANSPRTG